MRDDPQLQDAVATAYARLALVGGDPLELEEPFQTIVLADTAIGIIGNGGLEYFFESDFPGCPDYSAFASAFGNLGLEYLANGLRQLVAQFPFPAPHQQRDLRQAFLATPNAEFGAALSRLNEQVWQDSSIDKRLQSYGSAA